MRLVDADALKDLFSEIVGEYIVTDIWKIIDNAPPVPLPDFKEGYKQAIIDGKTNFSRPQGEWIIDSAGNITCSNCGFSLGSKVVKLLYPFNFSYCPDCGEKMKEGAE